MKVRSIKTNKVYDCEFVIKLALQLDEVSEPELDELSGGIEVLDCDGRVLPVASIEDVGFWEVEIADGPSYLSKDAGL